LGAATLLELIEAQVGLTRARTSEVEARYDYSLAEARLDRAVGVE
jgi:outer membrane protein TolC